MTTPQFTIVYMEAVVPRITPMNLEEKLSTLERRILSLEGYIFKKGHLSRAVREVIKAQDETFTANEIRDVVYLRFPDLKPIEEQHQVSTLITRMERAGEIICVERGAGPKPNLYQRNSKPPHGAGHGGNKLGRHPARESGFRNTVRAALADPALPAEFTIKDIRAWVSQHAPDTHVPYGTWSSTLFKLQQAGELAEVIKDRPSGAFKIYQRGPRSISANGAEIGDKEKAYRELRTSMNISLPEDAPSHSRATEEEIAPFVGPPPAGPRRQYGALTQAVRAIPHGREFTWRDIQPITPGTIGLLDRLHQAGELERIRPARKGASGWSAIYKRKPL